MKQSRHVWNKQDAPGTIHLEPMKARQNLRFGFTTGACAAAAAKAALHALIQQDMVKSVRIRLPIGDVVEFAVHSCGFSASEGRASVIKDAGDDPDVTDRAEI